MRVSAPSYRTLPFIALGLRTLLAAACAWGGVSSFAQSAIAQTSAKAPTVQEVLDLAQRQDGKVQFVGTRTQQCIRQDMVLNASAKVNFASNDNYHVALLAPETINGLSLKVEKNRMSAFFPKETLLFQNDQPVGTDEIKDLIMGRLTSDTASLLKNYTVTVEPELDVVALFPCYKLIAHPVNGYGENSPPGRRYWIAKETGILMKEERIWGEDHPAFFMSRYDHLSLTTKPSLAQPLPAQVSKLALKTGSQTEMRHFASIEAAKAAGKKVWSPTQVPAGFKLRGVDIMSLYGTDIVLLRYNDGLNNMVVTYRTKPNFFLTLMAGAFALALVDKISSLSYHAPNNYAVIEKGDYLVYAYGDIYVDTLKRIANTVPVPAK